MPRGLCALKLAKAITLPLPAESRHTNSPALTLKRTRGGGVGARIKTRACVYLAQLGTGTTPPWSKAARSLASNLAGIPKIVSLPDLGLGRGDRGPTSDRHLWAPRRLIWRGSGLAQRDAPQGRPPGAGA